MERTEGGSAQDVPTIEVEYQKAQLGADGVWEVVETGTHLFANDGRYRLDRRIGGETLTRIRIPAAGERIEINHALGIGMRGPDEGAFTIPAEGPMLSRSRRSATAPFEGIQMTSIGTKARGPLLLQISAPDPQAGGGRKSRGGDRGWGGAPPVKPTVIGNF